MDPYRPSISTVFFSEYNPIDRRYRPYSGVSVILSTVDIDHDQSTGRLKSHRPIDDTCEKFQFNSLKILKTSKFFDEFCVFRIFDKFKNVDINVWYQKLYTQPWRYQRVSNSAFCKHETPTTRRRKQYLRNLIYRNNEFLVDLLTDFCDGTTFHHLWDYRILSKRDDWILHVSEPVFGERDWRRTERDGVVVTLLLQWWVLYHSILRCK